MTLDPESPKQLDAPKQPWEFIEEQSCIVFFGKAIILMLAK